MQLFPATTLTTIGYGGAAWIAIWKFHPTN